MTRAGALLLLAAFAPCGAGEGGTLEVLSPEPGAAVRSTALVSWRASGGDSILLGASFDGGESWKDLATRPASDGFFLWEAAELPEGTPILVRLRLKDLQGRLLAEAVSRGPFTVDRTAPSVRLRGPDASDSAELILEVEASDGKGSGVASVVIWASWDGKSWIPAASASDPGKGVAWTAPHWGRWSLIATASDRAGNDAPAPSPGAVPQLRVFVHTPEPWIARFAVETTDYVIPPGYPLPLVWEVEGDALPEAPVTIEAKGSDGRWTPIARNLPARGRRAWKVPGRSGSLPELRLRALNARQESVRELLSASVVDADPPRVALKGPALWEKPGATPLDVEADDELSGLSSLALWWRDPSTGIWMQGKRVGAGETLTFKDVDGRYALRVTASDSLGNATPRPIPTDPPMLELLIDREPPLLKLLSPRGGEALSAGSPLQVSWSATDANLVPRAVALFSSRDAGATWELLKDSLTNDGEMAWETPRTPGPLWLRAAAMDAAGYKGEASLEKPVLLSPPKSTALVPPAPLLLSGLPKEGLVAGGRALELSWEPGAEKLTILIEVSADGGKTWEEAGSAPAKQGGLTWKVPLVTCESMRLRLSLIDGKRILSSSEPAPFRVASRAPRVTLAPPPSGPAEDP